MEKKDYNDNYSRVRHSNAKNRTMLFCYVYRMQRRGVLPVIYALQRAFGW